MSLVEFSLAVFALLVTPGPTNSLLLIAGAERGWARAVRLIPAELAAYLATTVPLALVGARLLEALPAARTAMTLLAAAWILWLAVGMWRSLPARMSAPTVTAFRLAITTLLNPKALVFGLVLLPAESGADFGLHVALFAAQVVGVAMLWALLGATLGAGARPEPLRRWTGVPLWRRAAALWLAALAAYLVGRVAGLA